MASSLGVLESLLAPVLSILRQYKPVSEVMLNSDSTLSFEVFGTLHYSDYKIDTHSAMSIIRQLAGLNDLIVDRNNPSLAVRLPFDFGGRFQAVIPPVSRAPIFSIRFPPEKVFSIEELIGFGSLTPAQASLLYNAVQDRKNIIFAGGTNTGKTSLANAILSSVENERVFVLEDNPEMLLANNRNTEYLLTDNIYTLRHGVIDCMRLRPDRILVGEIRDGGTAVELLKAWLTGHPGGIATIHASSAKEVKTRIYTLMQEVLVTPDRTLIDQAINVIVYLQRDLVGSKITRRVMEIIS